MIALSRLFPLTMLVSLCASGVALAQESDSSAVAGAAVADVRTRMRTPHATLVTDDSALAELLRCEPRVPSSCRIVGATALIQAHPPEVTGDAAVIYVSTWEPTGFERRPIYRVTWRLTLRKTGGRWTVASRELSSQT